MKMQPVLHCWYPMRTNEKRVIAMKNLSSKQIIVSALLMWMAGAVSFPSSAQPPAIEELNPSNMSSEAEQVSTSRPARKRGLTSRFPAVEPRDYKSVTVASGLVEESRPSHGRGPTGRFYHGRPQPLSVEMSVGETRKTRRILPGMKALTARFRSRTL